jgi:hypothetical protein
MFFFSRLWASSNQNYELGGSPGDLAAGGILPGRRRRAKPAERYYARAPRRTNSDRHTVRNDADAAPGERAGHYPKLLRPRGW